MMSAFSALFTTGNTAPIKLKPFRTAFRDCDGLCPEEGVTAINNDVAFSRYGFSESIAASARARFHH